MFEIEMKTTGIKKVIEKLKKECGLDAQKVKAGKVQ